MVTSSMSRLSKRRDLRSGIATSSPSSRGRARGVVVALSVIGVSTFFASGCSTTMVVKTDKDAYVTIDDQDLGVVDPEGVEVSVPVGLFNVPYTIERDGVRVDGELERTRPAWLPNTAGLCTPYLTAPCCTCLGVSCANPQLFGSPFICVIAGVGGIDGAFGACYGTCAQLALTPGWLSIAAGCGGLSIGMLPLFLMGFGAVPEEIVLEGPPDDAAGPDVVDTTDQTAQVMPW